MKVDGGCFCGHVTFEAEVDPETVAICHCTDCQNHSGAAYGVVVGIVDGKFRLSGGELKTYQKVADSGSVRALAFCPECGTRIHAKTVGAKTVGAKTVGAKTVGNGSSYFGLRVGTVRQRDRLKPRLQAWCRSAQEWVTDLRPIPKFEGQPTAEDISRLSLK